MATLRDLDWPDCVNTRDLGGLRVTSGGSTRFGAVVRSDHPSYLTDSGWAALWDHGVRTVISLETDSADAEVVAHNNLPVEVRDRRPGLTHLRFRIEDGTDPEFMSRWAASGLWGTPLYYADALARWPRRHAALVRHVARSRPGGVLLHCGRGCDRTGLATFLLLGVAGVAPEDIAADYLLSAARLADREPDYQHRLQTALDAHRTSVDAVFDELVGSVDLEEYLLDAGLSAHDLAAARERLLTPA